MANGIGVASGYEALSKSALAQAALGKYILLQARRQSIWSRITNTNAQNDVNMAGKPVTFLADVDVGAYHDYAIGGKLIHDQPITSQVTVQIGRAAYKSVPFDRVDMALLANTATWVKSKAISSMWANLNMLLDAYVIGNMLAHVDPKHAGNTAGDSCDVNLGSATNPRPLTPAGVDSLCADVMSLFNATQLVPTSGSELFALMSPSVNRIMSQNTGTLNVAYKGANGSEKPMLTGDLLMQSRGFTPIVTPLLKTRGGSEVILFVWKGAYMFYPNIVESRIVTSSEVLADMYQNVALYDGKMFYPQGIVACVVQPCYEIPPCKTDGGGNGGGNGGGGEDKVAREAAAKAQAAADAAASTAKTADSKATDAQTTAAAKLSKDMSDTSIKGADGQLLGFKGGKVAVVDATAQRLKGDK